MHHLLHHLRTIYDQAYSVATPVGVWVGLLVAVPVMAGWARKLHRKPRPTVRRLKTGVGKTDYYLASVVANMLTTRLNDPSNFEADPACGSGGFLTTAYRHMLGHAD